LFYSIQLWYKKATGWLLALSAYEYVVTDGFQTKVPWSYRRFIGGSEWFRTVEETELELQSIT